MKKEYRILYNSSMSGLEVEVNKALALGWKPQGGLAVRLGFKGADGFYQALIKDVNNDKKSEKKK